MSMTSSDYVADVQSLIDGLQKPMPREAAFALYGYITGLVHAKVISADEARALREQLPVTIDDFGALDLWL